ncbi:uncharacterized protein LY89DRAFT_734186 [Mollisia scopiformis]|uniref:Uncharacterized protein n=1 Tax=Mollisia scopiformis TaxID=149040 RepID=A0A194XAK8_MOLSC|nr:uncharacterized protein LY89DRAFT_734186 [Mollisia scopiformis]KUJ17205.1 hypothetical protein LY89DRAFT_734186 [Mollisia scopiformis]
MASDTRAWLRKPRPWKTDFTGDKNRPAKRNIDAWSQSFLLGTGKNEKFTKRIKELDFSTVYKDGPYITQRQLSSLSDEEWAEEKQKLLDKDKGRPPQAFRSNVRDALPEALRNEVSGAEETRADDYTSEAETELAKLDTRFKAAFHELVIETTHDHVKDQLEKFAVLFTGYRDEHRNAIPQLEAKYKRKVEQAAAKQAKKIRGGSTTTSEVQ